VDRKHERCWSRPVYIPLRGNWRSCLLYTENTRYWYEGGLVFHLVYHVMHIHSKKKVDFYLIKVWYDSPLSAHRFLVGNPSCLQLSWEGMVFSAQLCNIILTFFQGYLFVTKVSSRYIGSRSFNDKKKWEIFNKQLGLIIQLAIELQWKPLL